MSDRVLVTKSLFEDSRPAGGGVSNTGLFIYVPYNSDNPGEWSSGLFGKWITSP
jgi:hypothetical protein